MASVPVWLVALIVACLAPFFAKALQTFLEERLRRRTRRAIARALSARNGETSPTVVEGVEGSGGTKSAPLT